MNLGQLKDLKSSYEARLADLHDYARQLEFMKSLLPKSDFEAALQALKMGRTDEANAQFAAVRSKVAELEEQGRAMAAEAAFAQGKIALGEFKWKEARAHLEFANKSYPNNREYAQLLSTAVTMMGDFETARSMHQRDYELASEKDPQSFDAAIALNVVAGDYANMGDIARALQLFQDAAAILKKDETANAVELAKIYSNISVFLTDHSEALSYSRKAVEIADKYFPKQSAERARYYLNFGVQLFRSNPEDGRQMVEKSVEIYQNIPASEAAVGFGHAPGGNPTITRRYSASRQVLHFREEHVLPRIRRTLDDAALSHELGKGQNILRGHLKG